MKKYILEVTVFIAGAMILILELAAARIMVPYFGTSNIIWTSIIGIILFSSSVGYFLGGILADSKPVYKKDKTKGKGGGLIEDKRRKYSMLGVIITLSGIWILALPMFNTVVLKSIGAHISDIRVGAVLASVILFLPPTILLGIVSPFAVKLKLEDLSSTGKIAGKLSAIATLGSIAGTFLAGFLLIPLMGSSKILFLVGITLVTLSIFVYLSNFKTIVLKCLVCVLLLFTGHSVKDTIVDVDSEYGRIMVYTTKFEKRDILVMEINKGFQSAMFLDNPYELVYEYTKYYNLMNYFNDRIKNTLLIGGAAYSFPKHYIKEYPERFIDVVEIDPKATEIAKKHFYLEENDRLSIVHQDGRIYLNKNKKKYDAILNDAFVGETQPFHLSTLETAGKIYESLNENGVYLINIAASLEGKNARLLNEKVNTLKAVFPHVYVFALRKEHKGMIQNIMLVASKAENRKEITLTQNGEIDKMLINYCGVNTGNAGILTDDYAPIEYYIF